MHAGRVHDPFPQALDQLARHFGFTSFRPLQERIVRSVLLGRDTLGVLPTGGGKSVCFQVPALVLGGCTLVVSPLIALMQDQVGAARRRGIAAASLAGSLTASALHSLIHQAATGNLRLVYISPERLSRLAGEMAARGLTPALLAVDEAHCISEWGHDFRPAFRALPRSRALLGNPPVVALTGSATPSVRADIASVLGLGTCGRSATAVVASFDRPNLWFGVQRVPSEPARLEALLRALPPREELSIVYAPTRRATEAIAAALRRAGRRALAYHAGLGEPERADRLRRFLLDDLGVVVATSAFGMGIDKPNVRGVVHWSMPPTPESYYQEAGRAGRDGGPAQCVLLYRQGDADIHRRQLDVTFPPRRTLEAIWDGRLVTSRVPAAVRCAAERLRLELRGRRRAAGWSHIEARRRAAERRIGAVERYAVRRGCRRRALLGYFGERSGNCGACGECRPARRG